METERNIKGDSRQVNINGEKSTRQTQPKDMIWSLIAIYLIRLYEKGN